MATIPQQLPKHATEGHRNRQVTGNAVQINKSRAFSFTQVFRLEVELSFQKATTKVEPSV
jgi:hypothetical protein